MQKVHKKGTDIWTLTAITCLTAHDEERKKTHHYISPYHVKQYWMAFALRVRR